MESRTEKSAKNLIFALTSQGITILMTFISRTVFVYTLGSVYLGINGLFSNILTFLNLAEMGVASAITFSLYEPLAKNDYKATASIMAFYKNVYRIIGTFVLLMGFIITPFIHYFITSEVEIKHIELYFILYVMNTGFSYFWAYKKTLIAADQRSYINTVYQFVFLITQNIVQIVALILTQNFVLYLLIQILATVGQNIALSARADRMYPYIKDKNIHQIENKTLAKIKQNIGAVFCHKIGSAVVNSTDNIIISKLVSLTSVGIYSNYALVMGALNQLMSQFFGAITASVGNLGTEKDGKTLKSVFDKVFFLNFWMYSFATICCACIFQSFIKIWIGEKMLLSIPVLSVVLFNFYINGMRKSVLTFKDALGLYWNDRYKPIFESIINLIVSIVLAQKFGLVGVFIGTVVSCVTTSLWVEPYVLFKYGFPNREMTLFKYLGKLFMYSLIMLMDLGICFTLIHLLDMNGIKGLIIKILITVVVSNSVLIVTFFKTSNFKWIVELGKKYLCKKVEF